MVKRITTLVVVFTFITAHGLPTANDIVPEAGFAPSALAGLDDALRSEDKAQMNRVDRALADIEDMANNGDMLLEKEPQLAAESAKVHNNIVNLKTYAVDMYPKLSDLEEGLGEKGSSLIPFLKAFGKDSSIKSEENKSGGIITEYAELYAKSLGEYKSGLGKYQLEHLNSAILEGRDILTYSKADEDHTSKWILSTDELGLKSTPEYLSAEKLGDPMAQYAPTKLKIEENNEHADTQAALQFVTKEHNKAFAVYFQKQAAKADASKEAEREQIKQKAVDAEKKAFDEAYTADKDKKLVHVAVQSAAAMETDQTVSKGPSYEVMKKAAEEEAKTVDDKAKAAVDTTPKLVKVLEEESVADEKKEKLKEVAKEEEEQTKKEEATKAEEKAIESAKVECAKEGEDCKCDGIIKYGTSEKFTKHASTGVMPCTSAGFGSDPAPNETKICTCEAKSQTA